MYYRLNLIVPWSLLERDLTVNGRWPWEPSLTTRVIKRLLENLLSQSNPKQNFRPKVILFLKNIIRMDLKRIFTFQARCTLFREYSIIDEASIRLWLLPLLRGPGEASTLVVSTMERRWRSSEGADVESLPLISSSAAVVRTWEGTHGVIGQRTTRMLTRAAGQLKYITFNQEISQLINPL